jgi:hypothetical protein
MVTCRAETMMVRQETRWRYMASVPAHLPQKPAAPVGQFGM